MRSQEEIELLKTELDDLTDRSIDLELSDESQKRVDYACNVIDTLNWILENESTDGFRETYLELEELKRIIESS